MTGGDAELDAALDASLDIVLADALRLIQTRGGMVHESRALVADLFGGEAPPLEVSLRRCADVDCVQGSLERENGARVREGDRVRVVVRNPASEPRRYHLFGLGFDGSVTARPCSARKPMPRRFARRQNAATCSISPPTASRILAIR